MVGPFTLAASTTCTSFAPAARQRRDGPLGSPGCAIQASLDAVFALRTPRAR
jgi:hypothetical protein